MAGARLPRAALDKAAVAASGRAASDVAVAAALSAEKDLAASLAARLAATPVDELPGDACATVVFLHDGADLGELKE